jgi:lysophospholipase L1-like esterase
VGINDLSQGLATSEVAKNIFAIWLAINDKSPKTHLIASSLMPIRQTKLGWPSSTLSNKRVRETNQLLKSFFDSLPTDSCPESEVKPSFKNSRTWLDLYEIFADPEGELPDRMTDDGVHLTAEAYKIWGETLGKLLAALVPELTKTT